MAGNLIFSQYALIPVILYISYAIFRRLTRPANAFDELPWVGLPEGRFAKYLARFSPADSREALNEGFKRYSSKGLSFAFAPFLSAPKIVLPPSQIQWLLDQPDEELSFMDAVAEGLALKQTTLNEHIPTNPIHHDVVKGTLTRSLGSTSPIVLDELQECFKSQWGEDESQWTEHVVWDSMTKIFAQTSARIFIGVPLCRNPEFLDLVVQFAEHVVAGGTKIRGVPALLKPVLGYLFTRPNREVFEKIYKMVGPIIEERKSHLARIQEDPDYKWQEPFDLLQWSIHRAYDSNDPIEIDSRQIARRFCVICFAAIHTTSLTSTNLLFDIISADSSYDTIPKLREEIASVQHQCGGKWDKVALGKLVRLDSTIRESQRLHSIGSWALQRKAMNPNGVKLPDGPVVPYGYDVAVSVYCLQRDESIYDEANDFVPFRFSDFRKALGTSSTQEDEASKTIDRTTAERTAHILKDRNLSAVTTSLNHLPFGHGRHACPGRFFAIQEVKLMLVHVLMNYDIKTMETRPKNPWYRDMVIPNQKATVCIRKIKPEL